MSAETFWPAKAHAFDTTRDRIVSRLMGWEYYGHRYGRTNQWHPTQGRGLASKPCIKGVWLEGREWAPYQESSGKWILLRNEGWGAMGSEFKITLFWNDGVPTENKDAATRFSSLEPLVAIEKEDK